MKTSDESSYWVCACCGALNDVATETCECGSTREDADDN